jgi:hypothetical protein
MLRWFSILSFGLLLLAAIPALSQMDGGCITYTTTGDPCAVMGNGCHPGQTPTIPVKLNVHVSQCYSPEPQMLACIGSSCSGTKYPHAFLSGQTCVNQNQQWTCTNGLVVERIKAELSKGTPIGHILIATCDGRLVPFHGSVGRKG